jgi:MFS family permease
MSPVNTGPRADPAATFPMRDVVLGALVPALLFGIAVGIVLPLIPTSATRLDANLATAGFVAALLPIGKMLADLPAGALASRIGDHRSMLVAAVLGLAAFAGTALAGELWVLGASVLLLGAATALFQLARHAYLTEITPVDRRARVLSTLGGVQRLGYFLGPFLGALVIVSSSLGPAYWMGAGCMVATLAVLMFTGRSRSVASHDGGQVLSLRTIVKEHRKLFVRLGTATLLVGAVRGARQTVVPLWGEYLGLDPETISVVFGLSGALDMLLFYPGGKVMDRYGRLWVAVPSMLVMGVAMALLPFTGSATTLCLAGLLLGFGNGIGSGIIMTIAADVAPAEGRASFLGVWRLSQDLGESVGPLVIAAGTALGSLAVGIWVAASLGGASSAALARWVPRFSVHANQTTRRRAGVPTGPPPG